MKLFPVFEVAIPDSFTSNYKNLLQRSLAVGFLARAFAIFQVEDVYIYREDPERPNMDISRQIKAILEYLEAPQYLKKVLFKKRRVLRYVGMLPPLKAPHHKSWKPLNEIRSGELREGVVLRSDKDRSFVYVGLDTDIEVVGRYPIGKRLTVRITKVRDRRVYGEVVKRQELKVFWGYRVKELKGGLEDLLRKKMDCLKILTSRKGKPISSELNKLRKSIKETKRVLIVFGGPYKGIFEILGYKNAHLLGDFILNTIPFQATETVRTEEAVYITLGILNLIRVL
ncbi:hypothetical protein DRN86_01980 [Candidatus Geothermarchaeota archaeon]|nr:MAG: hypothetical protein DRN86_01980 [Candidatus Geothermarchaeota archaeon]